MKQLFKDKINQLNPLNINLNIVITKNNDSF